MDFKNQMLRLVNKWAADHKIEMSQEQVWDLATRAEMIAKAKTKSEMRKS